MANASIRRPVFGTARDDDPANDIEGQAGYTTKPKVATRTPATAEEHRMIDTPHERARSAAPVHSRMLKSHTEPVESSMHSDGRKR